ncbi:MAG: EF-hand domain-containing protein [Myxococcota bacterium]
MSPETELITKVKKLVTDRHGVDDHAALRNTFEAYDRNRTGCLEPEELSRVLEDAGIGNKLTRGMWVKGILSRLAREANDALSWNDFASAVQAA